MILAPLQASQPNYWNSRRWRCCHAVPKTIHVLATRSTNCSDNANTIVSSNTIVSVGRLLKRRRWSLRCKVSMTQCRGLQSSYSVRAALIQVVRLFITCYFFSFKHPHRVYNNQLLFFFRRRKNADREKRLCTALRWTTLRWTYNECQIWKSYGVSSRD